MPHPLRARIRTKYWPGGAATSNVRSVPSTSSTARSFNPATLPASRTNADGVLLSGGATQDKVTRRPLTLDENARGVAGGPVQPLGLTATTTSFDAALVSAVFAD